MNQVEKHRSRIQQVIAEHTFPHQRDAAERTYSALRVGARAVVLAAEMQSGKSGIALALACQQRMTLDAQSLCDRKQLKDTLYLVTMADIALQEQAKVDLSPCPNLVVGNFTNFRQVLANYFQHQAPKLIIIDECHYGTVVDSIRYTKIFEYLEQENISCRLVFISATPFSALYAAGSDSILRHNFLTQLIFHKTSNEYHGIRQMHSHNQIIKLAEDQRDFCTDSLLRNRFIRQYKDHSGPGWSLIRVPSSQAKLAQQVLLDHGIKHEQIHIIGQKLSGLEEYELSSVEDFKRDYETAVLFDDKLIAITVAGFRVGINFGQVMKETLINTWDSTIANIAAVVQANIGRACGYHTNTRAKHYTNLDAVRAYSELLEHLEHSEGANDFSELHQVFEKICTRYDVRGFDRGTTIAEPETQTTKKLDDSAIYLTKGYIVVPGKLAEPNFDYSTYTTDQELLEAIRLIREELLVDGLPYKKSSRAMRGEHQNWIKAQWVNGVTYDDYTPSCAKARAQEFTSLLDSGEAIEFNDIVTPGGGEKTEDKRVMASIFSIYNLSRQTNAYKRAMSQEDMDEICGVFNIEADDTLILLYQRGEYSAERSEEARQTTTSRIRNNSVF